MTRAVAALARVALGSLVVACSGGIEPYSEPAPYPKAMVILGIDGMDPKLVQAFWAEGKLPNLAALAARGGFSPLATTSPPQSPVAWSTFITGQGASGHGIYDFVHRDPARLELYLSTSRANGPERRLELGSFALPLGGGEMELLRRGDSFWQILERAGIPARAIKIPANFPPAESSANVSLSGMGTPDLLGTYGTFQVFTDLPALTEVDERGVRVGRAIPSGIVHAVEFDADGAASSRLEGPPDPMAVAGEPMTLPVALLRDARADAALIQVGDAEVILQPGEWSHWVPVAFDPGLLGGEIGGMVRFYLGDVRPGFRLYVSPINLDPVAPDMPLSAPAGYAPALAASIGRFYTQGMAEDTKALSGGVLSDDEFLAQAALVFDERRRMLDHELATFQGGLLFFYVSSVDLTSHMFWRSLEPDASPEDARYAHVIPDTYARVDELVGEVMARIGEQFGPDTPIVVMSDHGFASYRYKVNLNTWLAQHGYLALRPDGSSSGGPLGHIDWTRTQAYALGLNQLFINRVGREREGVVDAGYAQGLIDDLRRQLQMFRDPNTGARVVTQIAEVDRQAFPGRAPDLIIGYNLGYRSSDESAIGQVGGAVIERNTGKWSGDHCMDSTQVPGVILSSVPLASAATSPGLADVAPTILTYFGLTPPAQMAGRSLFAPGAPAAAAPSNPR